METRSRLTDYVGPGRETPPPADVREVRIGWFGPSDADHPAGGLMWQAATLAVEESNAAGGHNGRPFRLVNAWSENPWGTGVRGAVRLVYDDGVWALAGAPDGPSAHLMEQVVVKSRLAFVNPVATDKTTNLINVPWIFSCAPGDHAIAPVLAGAIVSLSAGRRFVLASGTDHDSRLTTTELLVALDTLRLFPARHVDLRPGEADFSEELQRLREADPAAIVVIATADDSARFVMALRQAGLDLPVIGGPAVGRQRFARLAGTFAEGVTFPLLWLPSAVGERAALFRQRFVDCFGREPDYTAAYAYDAMQILIAAANKAGLNRVLIRDALRDLSPWEGVTGTIQWDPAGHNTAGAALGTYRQGRPVLLTSRASP